MSTSHSERDTKPSSSRVGIVFWCFALFLFYALSVGPIARFYGKTKATPPRWLMVMYQPVELMYDHVGPVRSFYDWYFKLWGAR